LLVVRLVDAKWATEDERTRSVLGTLGGVVIEELDKTTSLEATSVPNMGNEQLNAFVK